MRGSLCQLPGSVQMVDLVQMLGPVPVLGHLLVLCSAQLLCSAPVLSPTQVLCSAPLHLPSLDQRQVLESVPLLAWEENVKRGVKHRRPEGETSWDVPPHWNVKMMMSCVVSVKISLNLE